MMRFRPRTPAGLSGLLFALCCFVLAVGVTPAMAQEPAQEEPAQEEPQKAEELEAPSTPPATPEQIEAATAHPAGPHHPPKTGKMVGDHWTPYEPPDPESFPPGSQVHIIEPGDTLWDLAGRFLTNAWLWPQIWDVNQYITDSHWIYPGDPLLIPGAPTVIAEAAPAPTPAPPVEAEPEPVEEEPAPPAPAPMPPPPPALVPMAGDSDVYCSNYITPEFEPPALFIAEREEGAKTVLSPGDIVFLSQGEDAGVAAGQILSVVKPEHEVWHPIREEESLGTSVVSLGRLRVIAVQAASATAEIVDACDAIKVGDYLVPFEEVSVPLSSPVAFRTQGVELKGENDGYIVHVMDDKLSFGQGDIVNIDLGSADGIQPGDVFTIFREWGGTVRFDSTEGYIDGRQKRAEAMSEDEEGDTPASPTYAQTILGQLVVLGAKDKTSTAKVLVSVREMTIGDKVELR